MLFVFLTLAEIIVHLITLSQVTHPSSRKLRLGNLIFISGTEGGKGVWVPLKKANNLGWFFLFVCFVFVGFFVVFFGFVYLFLSFVG